MILNFPYSTTIYIRLLAILGYSQYETEDVVLCTLNVSLITLGLGRVG